MGWLCSSLLRVASCKTDAPATTLLLGLRHGSSYHCRHSLRTLNELYADMVLIFVVSKSSLHVFRGFIFCAPLWISHCVRMSFHTACLSSEWPMDSDICDPWG